MQHLRFWYCWQCHLTQLYTQKALLLLYCKNGYVNAPRCVACGDFPLYAIPTSKRAQGNKRIRGSNGASVWLRRNDIIRCIIKRLRLGLTLSDHRCLKFASFKSIHFTSDSLCQLTYLSFSFCTYLTFFSWSLMMYYVSLLKPSRNRENRSVVQGDQKVSVHLFLYCNHRVPETFWSPCTCFLLTDSVAV